MFAAELSPDGQSSTGKLIEIPYQTVSYNNDSNLGGKTISIGMPNPNTLFTTSVTEGIPGHQHGETTIGHYKNIKNYLSIIDDFYADTVYYANPLKEAKLDLNYQPDYIKSKPAYGITEEALRIFVILQGDTISGITYPFQVAKMQRIWLAISTDTLGKERKDRYSIVAGVITGFAETWDANGSAIWSINAKGLSRFLELTPAQLNYFIDDPNKTLFNEISTEILKPVLLNTSKGMENILSEMSIPTAMMYSIWLANMSFTQMGLDNDYFLNNSNDSRSRAHSRRMFNHEPLWQFDNWQSIPARYAIENRQFLEDRFVNGKMTVSEEADFAITSDSSDIWADSMRKALYGESEKHIASLDSRISVQNEIDSIAEELFITPSRITVADLIPRVFCDPLITKMLDPKATLGIFQKKIKTAFALFGTSTMTVTDILNKIASTILAVCREDDFGNIILEIPKHWQAPMGGSTGEYNCNSRYKEFWEANEDMPTGDAVLHDQDYILDKMGVKSYSRTEDEGNIITHVDAPSKPDFITIDETLLTMKYTGRVSVVGSSNYTKAYLKDMQSRYGLRPFTTPPIYTGSLSYVTNKDGKYEMKADLKEMLNIYAESMLYFKNFAQKSMTLQLQAYHWLDCNRTLFMPERNEIWMIVGKAFSYSAKGSLTFSLTTAFGHAIGEEIGYPFLDMYIYAKSKELLVDAADEAKKEEEAEKKQVAVFVADEINKKDKHKSKQWQAFIDAASKDYKVDANFIKAVMWKETGGSFNSALTSPAGAKGLMQLMPETFAAIVTNSKGKLKNDILDPETNIRAGTLYLRDQLQTFAGKARIALLAYNAGATAVLTYSIPRGQRYNKEPEPLKKYTLANVWEEVAGWNLETIMYVCDTANSESKDYQSLIARQYWAYAHKAIDDTIFYVV